MQPCSCTRYDRLHLLPPQPIISSYRKPTLPNPRDIPTGRRPKTRRRAEDPVLPVRSHQKATKHPIVNVRGKPGGGGNKKSQAERKITNAQLWSRPPRTVFPIRVKRIAVPRIPSADRGNPVCRMRQSCAGIWYLPCCYAVRGRWDAFQQTIELVTFPGPRSNDMDVRSLHLITLHVVMRESCSRIAEYRRRLMRWKVRFHLQ